jgi:hypothetical protein
VSCGAPAVQAVGGMVAALLGVALGALGAVKALVALAGSGSGCRLLASLGVSVTGSVGTLQSWASSLSQQLGSLLRALVGALVGLLAAWVGEFGRWGSACSVLGDRISGVIGAWARSAVGALRGLHGALRSAGSVVGALSQWGASAARWLSSVLQSVAGCVAGLLGSVRRVGGPAAAMGASLRSLASGW